MANILTFSKIMQKSIHVCFSLMRKTKVHSLGRPVAPPLTGVLKALATKVALTSVRTARERG